MTLSVERVLGPFDILLDAGRRQIFMSDLSVLVDKSPFTLVAAVIQKEHLAGRYKEPQNPYHLALRFGLERLELHRRDIGDTGLLHVIFEGRGKQENADLFRRSPDGVVEGWGLKCYP